MPTSIRLRAAAVGSGGRWYLLLEGIADLVNQEHPEIEIEVVEALGTLGQSVITRAVD